MHWYDNRLHNPTRLTKSYLQIAPSTESYLQIALLTGSYRAKTNLKNRGSSGYPTPAG
jgi:hypothetical protein